MIDGLLIEREDGILRLTFDRPDALNALTDDMVLAATEAIEQCDGRAIVITGNGRAFCTGADVNGLDPSTVGLAVDAASRLIRAIVSSPQPVVAAVNGPAAGLGCSIAVACDFAIAHESAYFLLSFANIGLMPDGGATEIVAASIGRARALRMGMLGERLQAPIAAEIGLIHQALGDGAYEDEVSALVTKLATGATLSYGRTKAAVNASTLRDLEGAFAREREGQIELMESVDWVEGATAFLQKRQPDFTGK
ncbi:MAG: enoyl-CoA hydratase [Propionibacteriales bacterium]|nr:enoyl-CoA hydratase [Propionibacteriales bacterium]